MEQNEQFAEQLRALYEAEKQVRQVLLKVLDAAPTDLLRNVFESQIATADKRFITLENMLKDLGVSAIN